MKSSSSIEKFTYCGYRFRITGVVLYLATAITISFNRISAFQSVFRYKARVSTIFQVTKTMGDQFKYSLLLQQKVQLGKLKCACCSFYYSTWNDVFLTSDISSEIESNVGSSPVQDPFDVLKELESEKELGREVSECEEETSTTVSYKIVDSHCHPHLNQERVEEYLLSPQGDKETNDYKNINVLELACAVSQKDWQSCLDYASEKQPTVIPAIGVHPWYVMDELSENWLEELEYLLLAHPSAFVGEIGLCKCARDVRVHPGGKQAALQKQRDVFLAQMKLAAKLRRPVTVHCVQQMGPMMKILKDLVQESKQIENGHLLFPPSIAFHSFTGTSEHVSRILDLENEIYANVDDVHRSPIMYFGFSHLINYLMCSSEKSSRKSKGEHYLYIYLYYIYVCVM